MFLWNGVWATSITGKHLWLQEPLSVTLSQPFSHIWGFISWLSNLAHFTFLSVGSTVFKSFKVESTRMLTGDTAVECCMALRVNNSQPMISWANLASICQKTALDRGNKESIHIVISFTYNIKTEQFNLSLKESEYRKEVATWRRQSEWGRSLLPILIWVLVSPECLFSKVHQTRHFKFVCFSTSS